MANKYNGSGLPKDGDILTLNIPLILATDKYQKDGKDKEFTYYAKIGGNFGGEPIGDGTLMLKLTVYPAKSTVKTSTKFTIA